MALMKCQDCKRVWQDGGGAVIELPKETVERIECDAERMDEHGKVSRHIPAAMRRRVFARDHHRCRAPWCHSAHNLEPHHIEHFARGGKTIDDNLITLCWHHHTAIHEGKLRLTMENGEARFERVEPTPIPANELHPPSMTETAIRALVGMGFKKSEAQSFVETATAHVSKGATLGELVREALKRSPRPRT
jgi:5-methylcytosine-specific restriction endonuclease McrA